MVIRFCARREAGGAGVCRALTLLLALCLWVPAGCSDMAGNGNDNANGDGNGNQNTNNNDNGNTNGNTNDNGGSTTPGPGEIFLQFDLDSSSAVLARALGGDSTEYGFFGEESNGLPSVLAQVDVILPNQVAVRLITDDRNRPSQILASDDSALLLSYDTDGTRVTSTFIAPSGETTRRTAVLASEAARVAQQQSTPVSSLCALINGISEVMSAVLETCDSEPASDLCSGNVAEAADDLDRFCGSMLTQVSGLLGSTIGQGPSLTIPLGVSVTADADSVTPNAGVLLQGAVVGGTPPYLFNWSVQEGPSQPPITASSTGSISTGTVTLTALGVYRIRLSIFDIVGRSAFFDVQVVVSDVAGALNVIAAASGSAADGFSATLSAEASGGAPPYDYAWSLVDGPTSGQATIADPKAPETTVTVTAGGNYIFQVVATDALDATATSSVAVTIIDPASSLTAAINAPTCAVVVSQDTCVAGNGSIALSATVSNATSQDALVYEWAITQGSTSGTFGATGTTSTLANPILSAIGLETMVVELTVTDQGSSQFSHDEVSVQVIPDSDLDVVLLTDGNATLNLPESLFAQVTGAIGELSFDWDLLTGSGTFDTSTAQSVNFTPTAEGEVSLRVVVTDSSSGETAEDSRVLSVATFGVSILGGLEISRNTLTDFTATLSATAPSEVTYKWTATVQDPQESLTVALVGDTAPTVQVLASGDGEFELTVTVTEDTDALINAAATTVQVAVVCLAADLPVATAGAAQVAQSAALVTLTCGASQASDPTFRWRSHASAVATADLMAVQNAPGSVSFTMPNSQTGALEFECIAQKPTTQCEDGDATLVYPSPLATPTTATAIQTAVVGSRVTVDCQKVSGYIPDVNGPAGAAQVITYGWRQVDAAGNPISPTSVADFSVDTASGRLTFTAPDDTPQQGPLLFECRAVVADADGDLPGPYSTSNRAQVTVARFDVLTLVQAGDTVPATQPDGSDLDGVYQDINVGRIRLTNTAPGSVLFSSTLDPTADRPSGVFRIGANGSAAMAVVLQGDAVPGGGTFGPIELFDATSSTNLAFVADVDGLAAGNAGVFRLQSGVITAVALNYGGAANSRNPSNVGYCAFADVALAGSATVSHLADIQTAGDCAAPSSGIYSTAAPLTIAEIGDSMPDTFQGQVFDRFAAGSLVAGNNGVLAFAGEDTSGASSFGAFTMATGLQVLDSAFVSGRKAGSTNGSYGLALPDDLAVSSAGVVAFLAEILGLSDASAGVFTNQGTFGTDVLLNDESSPAGFDFIAFTQVAINAGGDIAFIANQDNSNGLYYYRNETATVIALRDSVGTAIRDDTVLTDSNALQLNVAMLGDVQLNDIGTVLFSVTLGTGEGALLSATQP